MIFKTRNFFFTTLIVIFILSSSTPVNSFKPIFSKGECKLQRTVKREILNSFHHRQPAKMS